MVSWSLWELTCKLFCHHQPSSTTIQLHPTMRTLLLSAAVLMTLCLGARPAGRVHGAAADMPADGSLVAVSEVFDAEHDSNAEAADQTAAADGASDSESGEEFIPTCESQTNSRLPLIHVPASVLTRAMPCRVVLPTSSHVTDLTALHCSPHHANCCFFHPCSRMADGQAEPARASRTTHAAGPYHWRATGPPSASRRARWFPAPTFPGTFQSNLCATSPTDPTFPSPSSPASRP